MRDTDRIWKNRYRWLLASTLVLVVVLVYWAVAGKGLPATLSDFWEAVLPNLAAALLIYLAVSLLLTWFGLSEADELRNEIARTDWSRSPANSGTAIGTCIRPMSRDGSGTR
jgi:hypothetical protein